MSLIERSKGLLRAALIRRGTASCRGDPKRSSLLLSIWCAAGSKLATKLVIVAGAIGTVVVFFGCWRTRPPPTVKWKGQDSHFKDEALESAPPP